MENMHNSEDGLFDNSDAEDEFHSCCAEDDEWQDTEESLAEGYKDVLDEFSLRMFFKGVSTMDAHDKESRVSGIGVVMERSPGAPLIQVQKKLDFHVGELVAEHLALMDGLLAALQNGVRKLYAFTDSEKVYYQIAETEILDDQLLVALGHRILELADKLEDFDLQLVSSYELERPLRLAKEAIGDWSVDTCPICVEEKLTSKMIKMNCSHKICSDCMVIYIEHKMRTLQVPVKCPRVRCTNIISINDCKSFLPGSSYELLERATVEADAHNGDSIFCPFESCSGLLNPVHYASSRASSSIQPDMNCIVCPECHRDICISCRVPWHSLMTCEEYQNLPATVRHAEDNSLHQLEQNTRWKRCQQCRRMIELTDGGYRIACWCGHEFCSSCNSEYRNGIQSCQCAFWGENNLENSATSSDQASEVWNWESFDSLPLVLDGYSEQERAQLALIQRFLAGGFSMSDHQHASQSPPRCSDAYMDTMRDLRQLPWLERFVSVISDSYHEDFVQ
ncbi:E3 ubiquitin-protein ligase [Canna indica]|uniref:RBR-type E3 ubiquitin transferase n=1 Tax=Canna indica TaxID=4628 RepID=A0AAQ3PZE6_9LILI|nr:E3 ubiquitin-protein ligase [Canna indica]